LSEFRFPKKKAVVRKNVCIEAAALDLKPSPECPACAEKIKPGLAVCRSCGAILDNAKAAQFGLVVPVQESLARKKNQGRELSGNPIGIVEGRQCLTNGCEPAQEAWQKVSPSRFFFWIFNFSTPTRQLGWTRWCAQSLRTKYSAGIDPACHIKIGLYAPRVAKQERTPSETYLSTAQLSRCIFGLTASPISYIMLTTKSVQFAPLWISRGKHATPESGFLFPPSAYCPADCEYCTLPCKLSRYHVGPHACGARHSPRRQSPPFSSLWKVSRTLVNFLLGRWSAFFGGAINDETPTTDSRGFGTCAKNPESPTQSVGRSCVCDGFFFPEGNRGQV